MAKKRVEPPAVELRVFQSADEIDRGVAKLQRRIQQLEQLDIPRAQMNDTGEITVARSNVRDSIREVFGINSPELREHGHIDIWAGPLYMGMHPAEIVAAKSRGRAQVIGILNGLIARLREKREDFEAGAAPRASTYFDDLNLHSRIADVSRDLFLDGHHWEAVFAAAKALIKRGIHLSAVTPMGCGFATGGESCGRQPASEDTPRGRSTPHRPGTTPESA